MADEDNPGLFTKIFRWFYPPLPKNLTGGRTMVIQDFIFRLLIMWPMKLLALFGSHVQMAWLHKGYVFLMSMQGKDDAEDEVMKFTLTKFDGVPVRVYEPKKRKGNGAIIFIHGGGLNVCTARSYDFLTRKISEKSGLVLVSIDYSLSPEHKHPVAIMECERAAVHFLTEGPEKYSFDPHKVVLMGDSAGGNLTAITVQRLRKLKVPQPKLQILVYPWLQKIDYQLPSYRMNEKVNGTSMLTNADMAKFTLHNLVGPNINRYVPNLLANRHLTPEIRQSPSYDPLNPKHIPRKYLPDPSMLQSPAPPSTDSINWELHNLLKPYFFDPDVNPLLHPNLEGTCKTLIFSCGIDNLRDEDILYAERLRKANVDVTHKHYENGYHGVMESDFEEGLDLNATIIDFISQNL